MPIVFGRQMGVCPSCPCGATPLEIENWKQMEIPQIDSQKKFWGAFKIWKILQSLSNPGKKFAENFISKKKQKVFSSIKGFFKFSISEGSNFRFFRFVKLDVRIFFKRIEFFVNFVFRKKREKRKNDEFESTNKIIFQRFGDVFSLFDAARIHSARRFFGISARAWARPTPVFVF